MRVLLAFFTISILTACMKKEGCRDPHALNYDPKAKLDSGMCEYSTSYAQFQGKIDANDYASPSTYDSLYYDPITVASFLEIHGGDIFYKHGVWIKFGWTLPSNQGLEHPLPVEFYTLQFGDGNDIYSQGTSAVEITSIDTVNRLVSGTFEATYFEDGDSTALHYLTDGKFTNVSY